MHKLIIPLVILLTPFNVYADGRDECLQFCNKYFPVVSPVDPVPVNPIPISGIRFPDELEFEDVTDQGAGAYYGTAAVLFPSKWLHRIKSVSMNGEIAVEGIPYRGRPVYRFRKKGTEYIHPLKFIIDTTSGAYYYEIKAEPANPTGLKSETSSNPKYANGNRPHFRFGRTGKIYGYNIQVFFDGKPVMIGSKQWIVKDGSKRDEPGGGLLWKPDSESDSKLVILGQFNKKYYTCTIKYN